MSHTTQPTHISRSLLAEMQTWLRPGVHGTYWCVCIFWVLQKWWVLRKRKILTAKNNQSIKSSQIMPNQNQTSQIQSINQSISRINNDYWWVYKYMSFSILLASDEPNPPVSKVSSSCMVWPVTIIQPLGSPGIDGERVGRNLCGWPSHFPWKRFSDKTCRNRGKSRGHGFWNSNTN